MDLCVYHSSDMDGWCSGALVNQAYAEHSNTSVLFKGLNYNPKFNIDDFIKMYPHSQYDMIYIVDYSFKLNELKKLLDCGYEIVWCDHHETAIQEYAKSGLFTPSKFKPGIIKLKMDNSAFHGYFSNKFSGAKITYQVMNTFSEYSSDNVSMQDIVELVSIHDVWDIQNPLWNESRKFQAGTSLYDFMPWRDEWKDLFTSKDIFKGILDDGETIIKYQTQTWTKTMNSYGGTLDWENLTWLCINDINNSLMGDTIFDPKIYDAILYYKYRPELKLWKLSFFNSSFKQIGKMNEIAQKYGGGGHPAAAGAMVKKLPFKLEDIEPIIHF